MIRAINAKPDSSVEALFSSNPQRGKVYADENGIPRAFSDLSELLSDPEIDVVYISTTNELHRDQAIAAASAGKHILCEKPLALSLEDARKMIAAAKAANVVLGTNHHLRCAITHRTLRRMIKEERLASRLRLASFTLFIFLLDFKDGA